MGTDTASGHYLQKSYNNKDYVTPKQPFVFNGHTYNPGDKIKMNDPKGVDKYGNKNNDIAKHIKSDDGLDIYGNNIQTETADSFWNKGVRVTKEGLRNSFEKLSPFSREEETLKSTNNSGNNHRNSSSNSSKNDPSENLNNHKKSPSINDLIDMGNGDPASPTKSHLPRTLSSFAPHIQNFNKNLDGIQGLSDENAKNVAHSNNNKDFLSNIDRESERIQGLNNLEVGKESLSDGLMGESLHQFTTRANGKK